MDEILKHIRVLNKSLVLEYDDVVTHNGRSCRAKREVQKTGTRYRVKRGVHITNAPNGTKRGLQTIIFCKQNKPTNSTLETLIALLIFAKKRKRMCKLSK